MAGAVCYCMCQELHLLQWLQHTHSHTFVGLPLTWPAGLTLLLDESGQLGWLQDLQALAPAAPAPANSSASSSGTAPAASAAAGLPPPPAPAFEVAVCLAGSSVRYEPADPRTTAAVLTAATISWRGGQGEEAPASSIEARRLALHVAAAGGSGGGGSPGKGPQGGGLSRSLAELPGFHQVASEAGLTIRLPSQQQQQQQQQQQAIRETVVTNRGLSITLSRHTLLLLQGLVAQLPARGGTATANGAAAGSEQHGGGLTPEGSASSLGWEASAASAGGDSGGGLLPGGTPVDVMRGVVPAAYASPRRAPERPLEASVFLDGGCLRGSRGGARAAAHCDCPPAPPASVLMTFFKGAQLPRHPAPLCHSRKQAAGTTLGTPAAARRVAPALPCPPRAARPRWWTASWARRLRGRAGTRGARPAGGGACCGGREADR